MAGEQEGEKKEEIDGAETRVEPGQRVHRAADRMLGASVPDDNHILMKMLKMLLGSRMGLITTPLAGIIMLTWVAAKWGVPAILASSQLILQLREMDVTESAQGRNLVERYEQDKTEEQANVQAIVDGLNKIDGKVDRIGSEVQTLRDQQKRTNARVDTLARKQKEPPPTP